MAEAHARGKQLVDLFGLLDAFADDGQPQAVTHLDQGMKNENGAAVTADLAVPEDGPILSDRIGHLPARLCNNRRNPFADPLREVRVRIETGKVLRILSNDLDASAEEIAGLYKRRWAIELFFRWVKQTLKITRFFGRSENAVRIQIAATPQPKPVGTPMGMNPNRTAVLHLQVLRPFMPSGG